MRQIKSKAESSTPLDLIKIDLERALKTVSELGQEIEALKSLQKDVVEILVAVDKTSTHQEAKRLCSKMLQRVLGYKELCE